MAWIESRIHPAYASHTPCRQRRGVRYCVSVRTEIDKVRKRQSSSSQASEEICYLRYPDHSTKSTAVPPARRRNAGIIAKGWWVSSYDSKPGPANTQRRTVARSNNPSIVVYGTSWHESWCTPPTPIFETTVVRVLHPCSRQNEGRAPLLPRWLLHAVRQSGTRTSFKRGKPRPLTQAKTNHIMWHGAEQETEKNSVVILLIVQRVDRQTT